MRRVGGKSRRPRVGWALETLAVGLVLFLSLEATAGLLPDVVKSVVGDTPRKITIALVVLAVVACIALYIRHLHAEVEAAAAAEDIGEEQIRRERAGLLQRVHSTWTRHLHLRWNDAVRIEVGLQDTPAAVHDPWGPREVTTNTGTSLPDDTTMRDIFEQHGHQLLVLGAPGAGKTVHLLELTAALVREAQADAEAPVPVFLLLTNWRGGSLEDWLISELRNRYRVSSTVASVLLAQGRLCFVLDGLDEVDPEQAEECVARINEFTSADGHPHCLLVLSCRLADYDRMRNKLTVNGAVTVQPLPVHAVHAFLNAAGHRVWALRAAAAADPDLARVLTTPLMLGIAVLAYSGVDEGSVSSFGTLEERRGLVYDAFVERMVTRDRTLRGEHTTAQFTLRQVQSRLLLMARVMKKYQATVIYPLNFFQLEFQASPEVLDEIYHGRTFLRAATAPPRALYRSSSVFATVISGYMRIATHLLSREAFPYLQKDFVKFARERALLRASGDGVAFIHKTFQDHLAKRVNALTLEQQRELYKQS
ncbi:NACHT domain-containing protein [Streptomyces sp. WMMB303]|uniref:NACHT domain-containing protein n=1 Tax=Streptomyces sp. WMMB303 TaxID=3034154 RepID=UPI0023ECF86A|nr:NACHT domain-containing protein [Streptomyces sp. WMMB303]MDF4249030.1 NACHT domain-containing protein [Streptomyces sp. WMMB303]